MAQIIVGGVAARSPMLTMLSSQWSQYAEVDKTRDLMDLEGQRVPYAEVEKAAGDMYAGEVTLEKFEERWQTANAALRRVSQALVTADPDIIVVFGDDVHELFQDDATRPKMAVYRGKDWRTREDVAYPVAWEFSNHVIEHLKSKGFPVQVVEQLPEGQPMPTCFAYVYRQLLSMMKPMVPVIINGRDAINQIGPVECYELGRAVREAVESWDRDRTVAVATDGSLSVGIIREDLDRQLLEALKTRDPRALESVPYKWRVGQSGESFNWIGAAGALEHLTMEYSYIPAYRSLAGMGVGFAFAVWQ